ncbi:MAG: M23 family metallopeptidase, partial [Candidatus Paceibacterota bacterium]
RTIVVDHGLGLMTFYMHLSKIFVNEGELVLPGQVIGLSGDTGYAERPHLHLTVRIGGVSIDPVRFMGLFKRE